MASSNCLRSENISIAFSTLPAFANAFAASWNKPWYANASPLNAPVSASPRRAARSTKFSSSRNFASRTRTKHLRATSSRMASSAFTPIKRQSPSVTPRHATAYAKSCSSRARKPATLADCGTSTVRALDWCRQNALLPLNPTTKPFMRCVCTGKSAVRTHSVPFPE